MQTLALISISFSIELFFIISLFNLLSNISNLISFAKPFIIFPISVFANSVTNLELFHIIFPSVSIITSGNGEFTRDVLIVESTFTVTRNYIDKIDVQTDLDTYLSKFRLGTNYRVEIDLDTKEYIFTGSKTRIYKNDVLVHEFVNIVRGEVNGDGKIGYADYVNVYNHIFKTKNPDSTKKLLVNEFAIAADMSGDGNIGYADYVKIYNKIQELKGGNN